MSSNSSPVVEGLLVVLPDDSISITFASALPAAWVVGHSILGGTSAATAVIAAINTARTRITLKTVSGTFSASEAITDTTATAAAAATGSITYGNPVEMAKAGGTITFGTPVAGDKLFLGDVRYQKVTTVTGPNQFTTIGSLTTLLDARADIVATDDGTTITITAADFGFAGNIKLAVGGQNAGTMAVSGSGLLTAGHDGDTVTVNGTLFRCVTTVTDAAVHFSSIVELEALIEALTGINSSQDGTTITITAAATGTAGNAITLALGAANTGTMTLSGALLTGGIDAATATGTKQTAANTPAQAIPAGYSKVEIKNFDAADDVWISLTGTRPTAAESSGFQKLLHGTTVYTFDAPPEIKITSATTKFPTVFYRAYA